MGVFVVEGKHSLHGTVRINGAKNSALKIMAAALLGQGKFVIDDVPLITDVSTMGRVLEALGVQVRLGRNRLELAVSALQGRVPKELAKSMRASIQVMGPLLARLGWVKVVQPGGCAIGTRPLDLHLAGLRQMGADIEMHDEFIVARARRLQGADITFRYPSVGATENILMAASLAKGQTVIRNAAREPEIVDIQEFLNKMGARIEGAGTPLIKITGVKELGSANYRIIPDRIEAGTYLLAFLITGGQGALTNVVPEHLASVVNAVREMGAAVELRSRSLSIYAPRELKPFQISTNPYPGFTTDLQPQIAVVGTQAEGLSQVTESVFDQRFGYTAELKKMGAKIKTKHNTSLIYGKSNLTGARLNAGDLRAGAALVLAALAAEGESVVSGVEHIDRGYEEMAKKLKQLGATISRVSGQGSD